MRTCHWDKQDIVFYAYDIHMADDESYKFLDVMAVAHKIIGMSLAQIGMSITYVRHINGM
jgi:hypothetical protein